jgi:hypothetical protein
MVGADKIVAGNPRVSMSAACLQAVFAVTKAPVDNVSLKSILLRSLLKQLYS